MVGGWGVEKGRKIRLEIIAGIENTLGEAVAAGDAAAVAADTAVGIAWVLEQLGFVAAVADTSG